MKLNFDWNEYFVNMYTNSFVSSKFIVIDTLTVGLTL